MALLPPSLASLAWLLGTWQGKTEENWLLVGDTLLGVAFTPGETETTFEILRVDAVGDAVRLRAQPGPGPSFTFPAVTTEGGVFRVEEPAHDFPQWVEYRTVNRRLRASIGNLGEPASMSWRWKRAEPRTAEVLDAADRAFAAEVAAGGVDAWVSWFAPDGVLWSEEGALSAGPEMRTTMEPVLRGPGLTWSPTWAVFAPDGALGFTVGEWTSGDETGHYLTLWKQQPDGSWKVRWDQRV